MSANVVDGLSVVYALARLRPIDITLPIWPAARRCIQTKKPMISSTGNSRPAMLSSQLFPGVRNSMSTSSSRSTCSSASDRPRSPPPVVLNSVPSSNVPVIVLEELLMTIDSTLPWRASSMNVEYVILSPDWFGQRLGSMRARATTPSSTHIVHRGQLPGRRIPSPGPGGRLSFDGRS